MYSIAVNLALTLNLTQIINSKNNPYPQTVPQLKQHSNLNPLPKPKDKLYCYLKHTLTNTNLKPKPNPKGNPNLSLNTNLILNLVLFLFAAVVGLPSSLEILLSNAHILFISKQRIVVSTTVVICYLKLGQNKTTQHDSSWQKGGVVRWALWEIYEML